MLSAAELLAARFFAGQQVLFKSYVSALQKLEERIRALAVEYDKDADLVARWENALNAKFVGRIEKTQWDAIDKAAGERSATLVRSIVASAKAEMHSYFGEYETAIATLKSKASWASSPPLLK